MNKQQSNTDNPSLLQLLGNIIWIIVGGFEMAIGWFFAGIIMCVTIIGIPWARSCFELGILSLWPFGQNAVSRKSLGKEDLSTGPLGCLGNIIWFVLAGWWLSLGHLLLGVLFCITIIGIPFGIQHFKLAGFAIAPIGKEVKS